MSSFTKKLFYELNPLNDLKTAEEVVTSSQVGLRETERYTGFAIIKHCVRGGFIGAIGGAGYYLFEGNGSLGDAIGLGASLGGLADIFQVVVRNDFFNGKN